MDRTQQLFLEAMGAALRNENVLWGEEVTAADLEPVLELAQSHHVLPMVFEAVFRCPAALQLPSLDYTECHHSTIHSVMTQAVRTEEFLQLQQHLHRAGVFPLVVKGIICRELYPRPDYRFSGDEDMMCGEHQFKACHKAMIDFGMEPCSSGLDSYEVPYRKEDSPLYIELHKTLFPQRSDVFADCNRFFEDAFSRAVEVQIQGQPVYTMCPTDHMLYLIVHAFKHFLHSGFGIRQVSDMALFANAYGKDIDWSYVLKHTRSIRAERFAAALFTIGQKYLGFSPEQAHYPLEWQQLSSDESALLQDLLVGGIYGASDLSRKHSSNMTLNAVADDKKGKKQSRNILRTIFPSAQSLEGRFTYLRRHPYLLPVAWICRILVYIKGWLFASDSGATDVIRTGSQRVALLREYGIID